MNLGLSYTRIVESLDCGFEKSKEINDSIEKRIKNCSSKEELKKLAALYGLDGCAIWFHDIINHELMDMEIMLEVIDNARRHVIDREVKKTICKKLGEFEKEGIDTSFLKNEPAWRKFINGDRSSYIFYHSNEYGNYWSCSSWDYQYEKRKKEKKEE